MIQIEIGTTSWEACPDGNVKPGYVLFTGDFIYKKDRVTPAMVWDDTTNNVRPMTPEELTAETN